MQELYIKKKDLEEALLVLKTFSMSPLAHDVLFRVIYGEYVVTCNFDSDYEKCNVQ